MSKIGVDLTQVLYESEVKTGTLQFSIAIFASEIVKAIAQQGHGDELVVFTYQFAEEFCRKEFPGVKVQTIEGPLIRSVRALTGKNLYSLAWRPETYDAAIKRSGVDLVWNPYAKSWMGKSVKKPYVSTVHDLIDYYRLDEKEKEKFKNVIRKSKALVSISNYVCQDCSNEFGIPCDQITMIPNSIEQGCRCPQLISSVKREYILSVNALREHKNIHTLIQAYALSNLQQEYDLILCAGGKTDDYYNRVKMLIHSLKLDEQVKILYQVSEGELVWLYQNASLFVTTSTQEGFGRTPVEAALHKLPVISTKETSLYEATMGLVHYVKDPYDVDEISEMMKAVLSIPRDEQQLAQIADTLLNQYRPERIARMYWDLFVKIRSMS